MNKGPTAQEDPKNIRRKSARKSPSQSETPQPASAGPLINLQHTVGNRAVQRLIAQRSGDGPSEVDDETAEQINRQRSGGQPLDTTMQERMSETIGEEFDQVKVHTGAEADDLNQKLGAKAFTTGQDIYFREGAYQPHSASGQELLAHELTHVVQQRHGSVGNGSSRMTVNAPGDAFEQQADAVSQAVASGQPAPGVQREGPQEEEEEMLQAKADEQAMVQAQELPEEEEAMQMQEVDDDEEEPMQF